MKRLSLSTIALSGSTILFALAACSGETPAAAQNGAEKPLSAIGTATFGRDSADEGERLFGEKCAFCHAGKSTGAMMLGRRLEKEQPAELHKRKDLDADYVKQVVRMGMNNMPPFTRVELTDDQLDKVAAYLTRNSK